MATEITLRVKETSPLLQRIARSLSNVEADPSIVEELFLLVLAKRSKASRKDIEEIANILEEKIWEKIEKELL